MDLAGKRAVVMGLGRFGGGLGVTRWLVSQGADVLVTDLEPAEGLAESVAKLHDLVDAGSVTLRLGEHNVSDFTTCELVVANPAVKRPWENRYLRAADAAGATITTELELLVQRLPNRERTIGVTGTAGKSTTSAMIAHILNALGEPTHFGGNIGGSLLEKLDQIGPGDWVVLELSSFMLYWLDPSLGTNPGAGWSPSIAVVTNIRPNHLDWHGDFGHYTRSKLNIVRHQRGDQIDQFIYGVSPSAPDPSQDAAGWANSEPWAIALDRIEEELGGPLSLRAPGNHNRANAAMAVFAASLARLRSRGAGPVPDPACAREVEGFCGLPHRLQYSGEHCGVRCYNDSKSTTPEATLVAVRAFAERSVHLIAGGYDKGSDLTPIAREAPGLAGLYTIGATGPALAKRAREAGGGQRVCECGTLERAVEGAIDSARAGEVILLSPGCASWDQFKNYEERGERFVQLITRVAASR